LTPNSSYLTEYRSYIPEASKQEKNSLKHFRQFYIDLAAITKVCANSTVINPDKKKTKQGRSSCIFDKLGCVSWSRTCLVF
jgi:hypothetical protein